MKNNRNHENNTWNPQEIRSLFDTIVVKEEGRKIPEGASNS